MIYEIIFWSLICVEALICVLSSINDRTGEMESPFMFYVGLVGFGVTMYFMKTDVTLSILNDIKSDWPSYILHFLGYLLIGVVWSVVRWVLKARMAGREFNEWWSEYSIRVRARVKNRTTQTEEDILREEEEYFKQRKKESIPYARNNKWLITLWIWLWPFSMVKYAFGSMLADFTMFIFNKMRGVYDKISDRAFGDTKFHVDKEE